ncbi:hypothetical protein GP486_004392 [Trichoglossum hirsutum]|uniref:Tubulin-specific chaperone D C-terminal domain-containing protein n=1 Tax=Trichoglossum hirsutum TaxID=265104 RepID=A0A9P8RP72_9PEZI|nr:hypothetical protein GP486_004392 [Trichoglossum hirsutum]
MDAPQHEHDIKLQSVSGGLLAELIDSLPGFLWRLNAPSGDPRHVRRRVKQKDTAMLIAILDPFQEWPQLLDPYLTRILPPLISAYLDYLNLQIDRSPPNGSRCPSVAVALPEAICKVLYTLCKVRGEKVISRFFNNEPKYLEPLLSAFEAWDSPPASGRATRPSGGLLTWEERYVMLLWLSHLLLAPFDLASISSEASSSTVGMYAPGLDLPAGLPSVTNRLLPISLRYLVAAGKERESAVLLLVRLALRRDMRQLGLLQSLISWALHNFTPQSSKTLSVSIYQHVGVLSFLAGVLASTDRGTIGTFIMPIFRTVQSVADRSEPLFVEIRSSALARKFMIKIFRLVVTLVLKPKPNPQDPISEAVSSAILEDVIGQMLAAVADKDTPIRYAASKALSVITAQLEGNMAAEVVEAVVGFLGEDVLWESDSPEREIDIASTAMEKPHNVTLRRNLNATNPLKWHGLTLTLSQLLFRRSPPPEQLPEILNSLILALEYEQRSTTGSSLGTSVRDAACFGVWALSRRYTTKELLEVDTTTISAGRGRVGHMSVPQLLATELVASASLDPSGNIRRGSSAALQELIGRHPDTIIEGIKVVQVVDYHAVARRAKAITGVAVDAAELDQVYWHTLSDAVLDWRGTGSPDAESRRVAARGVGYLLTARAKITSVFEAADTMVKRVFKGLAAIHQREVEERHGLLLALSEIVNTAGRLLSVSTKGRQDSELELLGLREGSRHLLRLWRVFTEISPLSEKDLTSSVLRPELTAEAACHLISSLIHESRLHDETDHNQGSCYLLQNIPEEFIEKSIWIISLAIQRPEENVVSSASLAARDIFSVLDNTKRKQLLHSWVATLNGDSGSSLNPSGKSSGHLATLGAVFPYFSTTSPHQSPRLSNEQLSIIDTLVLHASTNAQIETRVAAIRSLAAGVLGSNGQSPLLMCNLTNLIRAAVTTQKVIDTLKLVLDDYSVDSRGDVGSWVRMEAIDAVTMGWESGTLRGENLGGEKIVEESLISRVARLAAEKLDKLRFKAWKCLRVVQIESKYSLVIPNDFVDASQTSSYQYFRQLLAYLSLVSLRHSLLEGLALADHLENLDVHNGNGSPHSYGLQDICETLLEILKQNISNDRVSIPTLEVLAFLLDSRIIQRLQDTQFKWRSLLILVHKAHFKSGNVGKLGAAVKVYAGLVEISPIRQDVLVRLMSMLMHPFPKVNSFFTR